MSRSTLRGALIALVAAVLCGLIVACGGDNEDPVQRAELPLLNDATFAGRTDDPRMFATVLTHADGVEAYFCDDQRGHWFRGAASDTVLELKSPSGATLVLELLGDAVVGRLVDGARVTRFDLPSVQGDVLYRADTHVGEQRVLGGWIVLPDGAQRGVINTGTGSIASSLSSNLRPICTDCVAFASGLTPAAFTPSSARLTRNQTQVFTVIGFGDSYMSGEGAPVVLGRYDDEGRNPTTREEWSDGLPLPRTGFSFDFTSAERERLRQEARACHRGASGLGLAVSALQENWARVQLVHQTFACSGAVVANLIDRFDSGYGDCLDETGDRRQECQSIAHDLPAKTIRPQVPEAVEFLARQRLNADAVVMSIGGNDLGFGKIITDCLGGSCGDEGSAARQALVSGLKELQPRYTALGTALAQAGISRQNVFITQHPNPLRKTSTSLCASSDFSDPLLSLIDQKDAEFATSVHVIVNEQVALAAANNRWNAPIASHLGTEVGHGVCTAQPWYNDTLAALRTQGHDLPDYSAFIGFVSSGMVHPNQRGHLEGYKPAYQATLDAALRKRFTPRTPTRVRPVAFSVQNDTARVTLQWDDVNAFETRTLVRNELDGRTFSASADATRLTVTLPGSISGRLSVQACFAGAGELCSAQSSAVDVEVKVPTHVPGGARSSTTPSPLTPELRLSWSDTAPSRLFSTVELDKGGIITRRAVEGQELLMPIGSADRFRVAACNNLGCGAPTIWTSVPLPSAGLPPPCVPPQQTTINGCRG